MSIIIENPPETIRLEFQELDAGWHSLGECEATTSVGPRGFGALSITAGATAAPAVRMALELYGETPLPWRWTRIDDGARFEGRMQGAGLAFGQAEGVGGVAALVPVTLDLIALETVKRVDEEPAAEEPELDVSPEKMAALEALATIANTNVAAAVREAIEGRDPAALNLSEAISAAIAGAQDALLRIMAAALDDRDLTFENLEAGFGSLFAELAPVIIAERLLADQPEGANNGG